MNIQYLDNLKFDNKPFVNITEGGNIDVLKISLGGVKFDKEGASSKIIKPDLRYYWDGEHFGVHISDCAFSNRDWESFLDNNPELLAKLELLYLGRTVIVNFNSTEHNFSSLEFLYLAENEKLTQIHLNNLPQIKRLEASFCPQLDMIDFKGKFDLLNYIDLSFSALHTFDTKSIRFPVLAYLNLQKNKITQIDARNIPLIQYVFLKDNPLKEIDWPSQFENIKIRIFEIDKIDTFDEALLALLDKTDEELQNSLKAYLTQLFDKGISSVNRLKLIFIGNTTVGKSTLRRILLAKEGEEIEAAKVIEQSTHGVKIFAKDYIIDGVKVFVQLFDFGGQDYYHATHLPFYELNSLNVLVYGYEGGFEFNKYCANQFAIKIVEGREEVLYPINYWIGSLKQNQVNKYSNMEGAIKGSDTHLEKPTEIIHALQRIDNTVSEVKKSKLEIVQNFRRKEEKLKQIDLRLDENEEIIIDDIMDFNFKDNAQMAKEWLLEKVAEHAQERPFLNADKALSDWLRDEQSEVVYTPEELLEQPFVQHLYTNIEELLEALERLNDHYFGHFFKPNDKNKEENTKPFYIAKLDLFSEWIHEYVLTKELIEKGGYFRKADIVEKISEKHADQMIAFLRADNIIFKKKYSEKDEWVAPAYLPKGGTEVEESFLESFEESDCIFTFNSFFHSNIILMIIDKFEENLVLDANQKKLYLWKNKVLLDQKNKALETRNANRSKGQNEKAFLLIELKYPGIDKDVNDLPQLSIRRNKGGYVKDSIFKNVFNFIKDKLEEFKPTISVKTKFGNYIPHEILFQEYQEDGKKSYKIPYLGVMYSIYDFRLYWNDNHSIPPKIFIAYSKHDEDYLKELVLQLSRYEKLGEIVVFYDKTLGPAIWNKETKEELSGSDLTVCLVSPNMLDTDIVVEEELPFAYENGVLIYPIVLKSCNWEKIKLNADGLRLGNYNAYNKAATLPLTSDERADDWKKIANILKNRASISALNKAWKNNIPGIE